MGLLCSLNELMCIECVMECLTRSKSLLSSSTELLYNQYIIIIAIITIIINVMSAAAAEHPPRCSLPLHTAPLAPNTTVSLHPTGLVSHAHAHFQAFAHKARWLGGPSSLVQANFTVPSKPKLLPSFHHEPPLSSLTLRSFYVHFYGVCYYEIF